MSRSIHRCGNVHSLRYILTNIDVEFKFDLPYSVMHFSAFLSFLPYKEAFYVPTNYVTVAAKATINFNTFTYFITFINFIAVVKHKINKKCNGFHLNK